MTAHKGHCSVFPQMPSPANVKGPPPGHQRSQRNPGLWIGQTERGRGHLAPRFGRNRNTKVQSRQPPSDAPLEKLGHGVAV